MMCLRLFKWYQVCFYRHPIFFLKEKKNACTVLWKVLADKRLSSSWVACLEINTLHFRCIKRAYRVKTNGSVVHRTRRKMFCLSTFIDRKWSQFPTNKCQSSLERDFNEVTRSHEGVWRNLCRSDFLWRGRPATCVFLCISGICISVVFLFSSTFHIAYTLTITKGSFLGK